MTIRLLKPFVKDYGRLPQDKQQKVDKQLRLLSQDFQHPSLNTRKMAGTDVWEARIDYHFRVTFKIERNVLVMRRVGTHEIYRNP